MIWWLTPVLIVPLFFLWNVVHEGSHALAALASGRRNIRLRPWPHKDPEWGFVFGSVHFDGVNTTLILMVPYVVDVIACAGFVVAFYFLESAVFKTIFALALMCPIADTAMAVQARYRGNAMSDLARIHWGWAVPFLYALLAHAIVFGAVVVRWMLGVL
jgi:hypothetical protein